MKRATKSHASLTVPRQSPSKKTIVRRTPCSCQVRWSCPGVPGAAAAAKTERDSICHILQDLGFPSEICGSVDFARIGHGGGRQCPQCLQPTRPLGRAGGCTKRNFHQRLPFLLTEAMPYFGAFLDFADGQTHGPTVSELTMQQSIVLEQLPGATCDIRLSIT